ncbi:hypothetical protein Fmac_032078 [Flemingia macrophylla]|uniref:Secreted protein n=1 Tax=Flemingia macrophylla TaxID=520843 RepID=A0ABD1L3V0_9FABA
MQSAKSRQLWAVIWTASIWGLWNQRNNCVFRSSAFNENNLWRFILGFSWQWLHTYNTSFCYSFEQWCSNPGTCLLNCN